MYVHTYLYGRENENDGTKNAMGVPSELLLGKFTKQHSGEPSDGAQNVAGALTEHVVRVPAVADHGKFPEVPGYYCPYRQQGPPPYYV